MHTPFPWAQSDTAPCLVFADKLGMVDFNRPVAKFRHVEDARTVIELLRSRDEIVATLRSNLKLLEEELKNRRFSGVEEYVLPVDTAVAHTRKAIALLEGWSNQRGLVTSERRKP